jgi:hypothetical protein
MRLQFFTVTALALTLAACATTEFKTYEGARVVEGQGGTKVVVDGMEIWEYGEPPRKFKLIGLIEDSRPAGIIPMARLRGSIVKKARAAGGDAVIQITSQSRITGYYSNSNATAYSAGPSTTANGSTISMPVGRNEAAFAVIRFVD